MNGAAAFEHSQNIDFEEELDVYPASSSQFHNTGPVNPGNSKFVRAFDEVDVDYGKP